MRYSSLIRTHLKLKSHQKRLFAITKDGVATFNPQSPAEITNKWPWAELNGLTLDTTGKTRSQQEFLLHIRKKGKVETMKFSTEHRDELLTEAMQFYKSVANPIQGMDFSKTFLVKLNIPANRYFHQYLESPSQI